MTPDEYKFLYELEERHWWFVGMRRIVAALLDGEAPAGAERILDAGCGTGLMLSWLRRYGKESSVFGLDYNSFALRYSAQRGERLLVEGSIAAMPFPSNSFDLVTTFDVLHSFPVSGAAAPFAELARVLKPGGVPAGPRSGIPVPLTASTTARSIRSTVTRRENCARGWKSKD